MEVRRYYETSSSFPRNDKRNIACTRTEVDPTGLALENGQYKGLDNSKNKKKCLNQIPEERLNRALYRRRCAVKSGQHANGLYLIYVGLAKAKGSLCSRVVCRKFEFPPRSFTAPSTNFVNLLQILRHYSALQLAKRLNPTFVSGLVKCLATMNDGRRIVSGSKDQSLKIWDLVTLQCCVTLKGHTDLIWRLAVASDDSFIASASKDDMLKVGTQVFVFPFTNINNTFPSIAVFFES